MKGLFVLFRVYTIVYNIIYLIINRIEFAKKSNIWPFLRQNHFFDLITQNAHVYSQHEANQNA